MSTKKERELIKQAYPHPSWHGKVDKMSDSQVIAIFYKLVKEGKVKR